MWRSCFINIKLFKKKLGVEKYHSVEKSFSKAKKKLILIKENQGMQ